MLYIDVALRSSRIDILFSPEDIVQGMANFAVLRFVEISEDWQGIAKSVTFYDAQGNKAATVLLPITNEVPIPKGATSIPGKMSFIVFAETNDFQRPALEAFLPVVQTARPDTTFPDPIAPSVAAQLQEQIEQLNSNKLEKDGDSADNTVLFAEAQERELPQSGEDHKTLFGKILKWFSDLKSFAFSDLVNNYSGGAEKALSAEVGKNLKTLIDEEVTARQEADELLAPKTSVYTKTEIDSAFDFKVNKDGEKVLSDNNYTAEDKLAVQNAKHDKGFFATIAALEAAYPFGNSGDHAIVGETDTTWVWDSDSDQWVDTDTKGQVVSWNGLQGEILATTDNTPEGSVNKYFTVARVRDVLLTGLSTAYYNAITATDTVLSAFGKLQAQITNIGGRNAANGYVGTGADGRMALAQLPAEEGWITPTLLNSFTSDTNNPVAYKRDINGEVIFRGRLIGGASGATAFILPSSPVGYRPANQIAGFQCPVTSATSVYVSVLSNGWFVPYSTTGVPSGFYIDTVRYKGV